MSNLLYVRPEDIVWSRNVRKATSALQVAVTCVTIWLALLLLTVISLYLNYADYLVWQWSIIGVLLLGSSMVMLTYVIAKKHTFIADFPRGRVRLRRFVVAAMLLSPINWVVLAISKLRMNVSLPDWRVWHDEEMKKREAQQRREEDARAERNRVADENARREREERSRTPLSSLPEYSTHPEIGLIAYKSTMEACNVSRAVELRDTAHKNIERISEKLRELQGELSDCRVDLAKQEEVIEKYRSESNEADLEREFENLLALPTVLGVRVVNDRVRFVVRCQAVYDGEEYDLGDWYVWVNPRKNFSIRTKLLRDCRTPDGHRNSDPPHINHDGTFCFGGREDEVDDLVRRGQVFAAITVAINYMCQTLPGHQDQIPKVFKKITT